MKTFRCRCGQRLYFESTRCPSCLATVGWCQRCEGICALDPTADGHFLCGEDGCGAELVFCCIGEKHAACNRYVEAETFGDDSALCDMCGLTDAIPDLTHPVKLECFRRLESAKRRVLHQFQLLDLPPYHESTAGPPLSFDFKADALPTEQGWRPMGVEKVYTGHASGKITINIREADSVERERLRVQFGESYRTLTGHFRHELAHYLWDAWILNREHEAGFVEVFGDPTAPLYVDALKAYYQKGPKPEWEKTYVSAYASMHPFEDWAETAAILLNAHATLETARHYGMVEALPTDASPVAKLEQFIELGDFLNEVSREMGLLDAMPGTFTEPVRRKMAFIRQVIQQEND